MIRQSINRHTLAATIAVVALAFASTSAHAFRCGQRIVKKDMHELEVRKACGEPAAIRHLGYAVRDVYLPLQRHHSGGIAIKRYPGYGRYMQEVALTEYIYNFGPQKFMRRLLFEAGILVRIESLGYGYREKQSK